MDIKVSIRIRPFSKSEELAKEKKAWKVKGNTIKSICDPNSSSSVKGRKMLNKSLRFDFIFNEKSSTKHVHTKVGQPIITSLMKGFNGTIFCYGQTGSGKTFTLTGNSEIPGIIPLAVKDVFNSIKNTTTREFLLRVSYLEIYNEKIQDLLNPNSQALKVKEDPNKGFFVQNLREEIIVSVEQVMELISFGNQNRHVGATNVNEHSSRSHCLFRMVVESRRKRQKQENQPTDQGNEQSTSKKGKKQDLDEAVRVSCLNLVDLAGSERIMHSQTSGQRLVEGIHINKSLLALSNVISRLSDRKSSHIPYRDSNLTKILKPSIGGNAMTAIICTLSPAFSYKEISKSTLQFAQSASRVKNKPQVNEILDEGALLRKYRRMIKGLKTKLKVAQNQDQIKSLIEENQEKQKLNEEMSLRLAEQKRLKNETDKQVEKLKTLIISSNSDLNQKILNKNKKKIRSLRRETWCPGHNLGGFKPFGIKKKKKKKKKPILKIKTQITIKKKRINQKIKKIKKMKINPKLKKQQPNSQLKKDNLKEENSKKLLNNSPKYSNNELNKLIDNNEKKPRTPKMKKQNMDLSRKRKSTERFANSNKKEKENENDKDKDKNNNDGDNDNEDNTENYQNLKKLEFHQTKKINE